MRRLPRWAAVSAWWVPTWCAAVAVGHFCIPQTWGDSLATGMAEIPLWVGLGIAGHRRAERRASTRSAPAVDPQPGS
ncbi:hypothetical protein [Streptacidiphilus rugosus]|uniref:hypothetical protein n=1 Tax=Streptacidiphilus rugosus TaxID=405783 RepID=UPI0018DB83FB|nr:hypothetical protein [Streptacidiphilus rugosus]